MCVCARVCVNIYARGTGRGEGGGEGRLGSFAASAAMAAHYSGDKCRVFFFFFSLFPPSPDTREITGLPPGKRKVDGEAEGEEYTAPRRAVRGMVVTRGSLSEHQMCAFVALPSSSPTGDLLSALKCGGPATGGSGQLFGSSRPLVVVAFDRDSGQGQPDSQEDAAASRACISCNLTLRL